MDTINLMMELMKIDSSIVENANRAIEYAAEYLKENGVMGDVLENEGYKSYVATIGQGDKTLVLNGHLDVVSGKANQFIPIETEERIIGRGGADMKGGCAAMMQAMIRLKDEALKSKVMLQLVPDEEVEGRKGSGFLVEQGYLGDFVICTEPTNIKISIQSKGIIMMDVISSGASAHGSRPWEGVNAISKAFENFKRIEALPILNIGSDFYEGSTVNLARIKGGDIYNRVPDECKMGLDIRYVPHIDSAEIVNEIEKVVDGEVRVRNIEHGVEIEPDNPHIHKLVEVVGKHMPGDTIEMIAQHGASDARYFAAKGIPAIEFGPSGNHWHGDHEYVEKESVRLLEEILVDFAKLF